MQNPSSRQPSLFDRTPERRVLSVSELTGGLREIVESAYDDVWVEGELSNFKRHTSGHCYFTLKDQDTQIRAVMWRHHAQHLFFQPQDGMLVQVHGSASVYERRGDLQLVLRSMRLAGEGALQKAFEELKRRLYAEGLFDAEHKRPLPRFPEAVGIVTSGTGAALQDILSILQRRFPHVRVLVCPVQVQGLGAAQSVAEAIEAFNALPEGDPLRPDLLIVGRGGGSAEDLWAFNEEVVARAVFASELPIVSAVGHETDVSIADYVADVRAATPSMAAELVVPHRAEVAAAVRGLYEGIREAVLARISDERRTIHYLTGSHHFNRPVDRLRQQIQRVDELTLRLHRAARRRVERQRERVGALQGRLQLLDPGRPLERGYVRVERDGRPVRRAAELAAGTSILLRFHDGTLPAHVDDGPRAENG